MEVFFLLGLLLGKLLLLLEQLLFQGNKKPTVVAVGCYFVII